MIHLILQPQEPLQTSLQSFDYKGEKTALLKIIADGEEVSIFIPLVLAEAIHAEVQKWREDLK